MLLAIALGVIFYIYSAYMGNFRELEHCVRFLIVVVFVLIFSSAISIKLWGYNITEITDALVVVMLYWILMPLINAVIYWYSIGIDFIDAVFESFSGFSGTGLTVIPRPEEYPYIILIWRATTQWIGELSVVVFSGALLPHIHRILSRIYMAERGIRFAPTILSTTRRMLGVYILLTAIGTLMLMYSGMGFLDALAHSLTGIATGGMSTNSQSIMYWYKTQGYLILISSTVIMVLGALNFVDLYNLVRGKVREFIRGFEVKWFFYIAMVLGIVIVLLAIVELGYGREYIFIALYHMISGLTTTGFQVGDIGVYPDTLKLIIILAMMIGGATFSTAGGIKIQRTAIALKSIVWSIAKPFLPEKAYIVKRANGKVLEDEDIIAVYAYILLYIAIVLIASISLYTILYVHGYRWSGRYIDALFETVSALSCVGLSVGITSITMPLTAKILLIVCMYLGRLEFIPIYLVVGYILKQRITL